MEDDMPEKTYEKKVGIRDIVSFFQLEQLTGDDSSLNRWTVIQDLNRKHECTIKRMCIRNTRQINSH